ncbi:glycosyltransferase [Mameliella alba]|nr:glycosyltransferase [Mameliella alba]MBY6172662.1 glycosyltransferase [Mameliella alba]MBY6177644.1 glycosyltransferase [Mameliella alba]
MQALAQKIDLSADGLALPHGVSKEILDLSKTISNVSTAAQILQRLEPVLKEYRADKNVAMACGLLVEKQRTEKDMRSVWEHLQGMYPKEPLALRMLMRWHRRDGMVDEGISHVARCYPECWRDLTEAKLALPGLVELKAWAELDQLWNSVSALHPADRAIRMDYIKALMEQSRYIDAAQVAKGVKNRDRMGRASQELLRNVEHKAGMMAKFNLSHSAAVIDEIIARAPAPRQMSCARRVVFFTGQLGTGGAERQLTRIASAFHDQHKLGHGPVPEVWVKHANPATGADFYRPMLKEAGIPTRAFAEERQIQAAEIDGMTEDLSQLIDLLSPDVRRHTLQLVPAFRKNRTDVAYIWQDGGIVQAAIAAVLAGVPRIVTSFRGLPPNLRPTFMRDELPVLYKALAAMPHVTLTANSQRAATAYEDWLLLEPGTVLTIPNAVRVMPPDGDDSDQAIWFDILNRSEPCTKTVLGVFRFDANKRPLEWIRAAGRYLAKNDDCRFVMLGSGALFADAQALIKELGLTDRVFAVGIRSNVGFYMHRADLVMHLAQMEGLPNVLIEAQLVGTPVLATPAGGTDEVVERGVTGAILSEAEVLDETELDHAIEVMLSDMDRLARFGATAMVHSVDRFSVETILQRTLDLFNRIEEVA